MPTLAFFAGFEGSSRQATPGKRALGLRVVGREGRRLPWGRAFLRSGVKLAPWELAHGCLWRIPGWPGAVEAIPTGVVVGLVAVWLLVGLYLTMPLISPWGQTPYDRVAGSFVVRAAATG